MQISRNVKQISENSGSLLSSIIVYLLSFYSLAAEASHITSCVNLMFMIFHFILSYTQASVLSRLFL